MEKVALVGIRYRDTSSQESDGSMTELSRLAETAGGEVAFSLVQRRVKPDPACLIGEGKAGEIAVMAKQNGVKTVIFDEELTPAQQRNLEKIIPAKIIDRTGLILDIFARRARTREGGLQVELARLNYYLPRLARQGVWLDSQAGGIGTRRGPGEKKLEYDKREIRDRIAALNREIDNIRSHRELQRKKRKIRNLPVVGLVGYTNAGKSTLLNSIVGENTVYADDKLFATLDPTIRRVVLPSGRTVLMSDTVGFIDKLPHQLIASFRATLEGIAESSCLVHVIDMTSADSRKQEEIADNTLKEIGAGDIPVIKAYNKCDLLAPRQKKPVHGNAIPISAKTGAGLDRLLECIDGTIATRRISREIFVPHDKSSALNLIYEYAIVNKKLYNESGIKLRIQADTVAWNRLWKLLKNSGIRVRT